MWGENHLKIVCFLQKHKQPILCGYFFFFIWFRDPQSLLFYSISLSLPPSAHLCFSLLPSLWVWLACVVYVPSRCSVDLCCHLPDYLPDSLSLFSNVQSIIIN